MKTLLAVCLVLAAGGLAAQAQEPDQSLGSGPMPQWRENPIAARPTGHREIKVRNFAADGLAVDVAKSRNPLRMFNPFDENNFTPRQDNIDRDLHGKVLGWSILSIKF